MAVSKVNPVEIELKFRDRIQVFVKKNVYKIFGYLIYNLHI